MSTPAVVFVPGTKRALLYVISTPLILRRTVPSATHVSGPCLVKALQSMSFAGEFEGWAETLLELMAASEVTTIKAICRMMVSSLLLDISDQFHSRFNRSNSNTH